MNHPTGVFNKSFLCGRPGKHVILALAQVCLLWLVFFGFQCWSQTLANIWNVGFMCDAVMNRSEAAGQTRITIDKQVNMEQQEKILSLVIPGKNTIAPSLKPTDAQWNRVEAQFICLGKRASHHLSVMMFFYRVYFSTIMVGALTTLIAGVFLLIVSKQGWNQANEYILNILIVMTAQSIFYLSIPAMFEHKNNITNNQKMYIEHVNIYENYRTYLATNSDENGKSPNLSGYMHDVDSKLSKLSILSLEMELSKIPQADSLNKALGKI